VPHRLLRWWRGLCVRPDRDLRRVPTDDLPPPTGAARGGPGGLRAAWHLGLLLGPPGRLGSAVVLAADHHAGHGAVGSRRVSGEAGLSRRAAVEGVGTAVLVIVVIGVGHPGDPADRRRRTTTARQTPPP